MFKGLGNLGNIAGMVGSLQEIPDRMKELNERMKAETVSATSGCSSVAVTMSGTGHVHAVKITGDLQGEALEHAIKDATNAAGVAAKQLYADSIREMVEEMDLKIPGIDKLLASFTVGG